MEDAAVSMLSGHSLHRRQFLVHLLRKREEAGGARDIFLSRAPRWPMFSERMKRKIKQLLGTG